MTLIRFSWPKVLNRETCNAYNFLIQSFDEKIYVIYSP